MSIEEFLQALGARIGINDLSLNDENVCRLALDQSLIIDLEFVPDGNLLQVYSVLGVDPGPDAGFYRTLLSANLFGQGTGGGTIGLDEDNSELILGRCFQLDGMNIDQFDQSMEAFINAVEAWTREIAGTEITPTDNGPTRSGDSTADAIRV